MATLASLILAASLPTTTNLIERVEILWTAHTNRVQMLSAARGRVAIEKVRKNLADRKRKSAMGKSAGGVK